MASWFRDTFGHLPPHSSMYRVTSGLKGEECPNLSVSLIDTSWIQLYFFDFEWMLAPCQATCWLMMNWCYQLSQNHKMKLVKLILITATLTFVLLAFPSHHSAVCWHFTLSLCQHIPRLTHQPSFTVCLSVANLIAPGLLSAEGGDKHRSHDNRWARHSPKFM